MDDGYKYSLSIKVQTEKDLDITKNVIDKFMTKFKIKLMKYKESAFQLLKTTLYKNILTKPVNMNELTDIYFREIRLREYTFDRKQQVADILLTIKLSEIVSIFNKLQPTATIMII